MQPQKQGTNRVAGCVVGIGCLVVFGAIGFALSQSSDARYVILAVAAVVAILVAVYVIRNKIARETYEIVQPDARDSVKLGATLRRRPAVLCKKGFRTGRPVAQLICREHAINRGGTSDSHYHNERLRQETVLGEARRLNPGDVAEFAVDVEIPADGVPSFSGQNNHIEWELVLRVPAPGFIPDIREVEKLDCLPEIAPGADRSMGTDSAVPAQWLAQVKAPPVRDRQGPVSGRITCRNAATSNGLYVVACGESVKLDLSVETASNIHCRNVLCWVGCKVHGSGSEEKVAVLDWHSILEGDFNAGLVLNRTLDVRIPDTGPVSFQGRYVKMDWMVRVRVDIPIWRDKVLELPFIVTPRLG